MGYAFQPGQRWISDGEPELGLGCVERVDARTVTVLFPGTGERRAYAQDQPPLRRARFREGDTVLGPGEVPQRVVSVAEAEGLLVYGVPGGELRERELSGRLVFTDPLRRLLAGDCQPPAAFALRCAALGHQHRRRRSPLRGFLGGRVELLPHQLYVASQVTGRLEPRVLLADEVGLGKTIEACLILHRLLLTGRARRVLVLVPESLVHQWFLELFRRFNLWFHIFDEDRCADLEKDGSNPFQEAQLVLCSLALLAGDEVRGAQALEAGWDLLVVDEAHHLAASSPAQALVERLGRAAPGLLLLTGTPEQLGVASHFSRLRLLDPDRFHDLDAFLAGAARFREVAALAVKLLDGLPLFPAEVEELRVLLGEEAGDPVEALLDRHGTGRVLFRNTRAAIQGFPRRVAHLVPLESPSSRAFALEFASDVQEPPGPFRPDYRTDPRLDWLADLLRQPGGGKVLLLCRTRAKAEAIEKVLRQRVSVKTALFHEGLALVQRDRNAAWFAEPGGARILLCSELGSEGRNFQFAHDLVLFDLPLDPDLLEQRLGRLDRIGQTRDIQVWVPYPAGTAQEGLARWYHEGLDAFQRTLHGGGELLEPFRERLVAGAGASLLEEARAAREALARRLEQGRDRLLELNSFRPGRSEDLVRAIREQDADPALDLFMLSALEQAFVEVEELAPRTYRLGAMGSLASAFPGLPPEGLTITFDRQRALAREELQFLTWDHPLVTGALDLLLGAPTGTTCFSHWPDAGTSGLYLEAVFLLACVAPPQLHADRFLPPTPLRVLVDAQGADLTRALPRSRVAREVRPGDGQGLLARTELGRDLLPRMLRQAEDLAARRVPALVARAREEMTARLGQEQERLRALARVNGAVGAGEIRLLEDQQGALDRHLREARLRLDAIHLVHRGRLQA